MKSVKNKAKPFIDQFLGVILASLMPVVLAAFLSIPHTLEGPDAGGDKAVAIHMT